MAKRTFTKYPSNYVKAVQYPAWCYSSPEEYEAAQEDDDGPVILSDGMEIEDKSQAYIWLRENVEQYGSTYFWDSSLKSDLNKLIDRFGNTYFWRS